MSADSNTVCPNCCDIDLRTYTGPQKYPLVPAGVIDHAAEEFGLNRPVRENIDYYHQAKDGTLILIFEYRADCWDCNWHFETKMETPLTGIDLP